MSHIADLPFLPNALEAEFIPPLELIERGQYHLISFETQLAATVAWQEAGGNADNDGATPQAVPPRIERRQRAEVIAFPDRRAA